MTSPGRIAISFTNEHDSVDGSCASGEGSERIIRLTQGFVATRFEVHVESTYSLVALSVRTACEQAATEIGCAIQLASDDPATVIFGLGAEETAYIVVEAQSPLIFGSFSATIAVSRL
jgi:hypothetical protein